MKKKGMITIKINNSLDPRQEVLDNVEHTVYPVIMINEGVHNRVLYTKDELARTVQNWNNSPVPIGHPSKEGRPISCNSPDVHNNQVIGKVFNAHMQDDNLKGELYLNNDKVTQLIPDLFTFLENEGQMDVSTGLFCDDIYQSGDFNGEEFDSIAVNILADHLAILPGDIGACSWSDGCGIRANKTKKGGSMKRKKKEEFVKNNQEFLLPPDNQTDFKINEADYEQVLGLIYRKLDSMDIRDEKYHYPIKVYEDRVIYRIRYRDGGTPKLMQRNYQLNEHEDGIEWTNDPIEVVRNETFTPKTNKQNDVNTNNKKKENEMEKKIKTMKECCPDTVTQFIKENEQYKDNEEILLGLSEEQFKVLMKTNKKEEPKKEEPKDLTFNQLLNLADNETKQFIQMGAGMVKQRKENMINIIKANESNSFSDDELEGMDISVLEKMANLAQIDKSEDHQDFVMKTQVSTKHQNNDVDDIEPLPDPTSDIQEEG